MADDQFQILRQEIGKPNQDIVVLSRDVGVLRQAVAKRFAEVEAQLDTKPDQGKIYRAILAMNSAMLAAMVGFVVVANILGAFGA